MQANPTRSFPRRRCRGFTLIELMIAVAIVAILVALAYPSWRDSVRKGRRSEAFSAIVAVQQAQERSRANFPQYCNDLTATPAPTSCGLQQSATTPTGYYSVAIADVSGTGYKVTAAATGSQAGDTKCLVMGALMDRGSVNYFSSTTSTIDWSATGEARDPSRCWAK